MSTYTDLHNQVKENITVDYNNRITTQRVRFLNEQNEFWGTLRGNVSAENITIDGGVLKGVTLEDTILNGSLALPDGIDLHKVLQHVKELSTNLTETTEKLDQEIIDRKDAIRDEENARSDGDTNINSSIGSIGTRITTEMLSVRKDLDTQVLSIKTDLDTQVLSVRTDLNNEILSVRTDYKNDIDKINVDIYSQSKEISTLLSSVLGDAIVLENETREKCDRYLSTNIDIIKDNVSYLSDEIDETRASLVGEVANRQHITSKLELSVATKEKESINRDNILSEKILEEATLANKNIADLSSEMFAKIEHDRHYVINSGSTTASTTDSWPYSSKDFAINIYNPTIHDGIAYYKDASGEKYNVGQIFKASDSELYPFTLKTLNEIQHSGVESALVENWPYGFDSDKKSQRTEMNGYTIAFDDTKTTGQLSDFSFNIIPTLPQFHKMEYYGSMIGKVTEAYPVDYYEDLLSGKIWIDTKDSELETFNKFRNVIFDKKDLSVINKETERITYLGNNKFKLQKNINRTPFIGIHDKLHSEHTQFGRIFERRDGIQGIVKDGSKITELNVYMDDPHYKMIRLYDTYNFRSIVKENIPYGDSFYDIVLSANVINDSASFDLVNVSELYKYNFNKINVDGVEVVGGYVVPRKYNKTIVESTEFDAVDVNIADVMWINAFKGTHTLTKVPNEPLWTFEDLDDDKNILNIMFNGTTLYIKVTSGNDGSITKQQYQVRINEPIIFNPTTCHTHVYTSNLIDLSKYTDIEDASGATYEITIDPTVTTEAFPKYKLLIEENDTDILKIQVPERTSLDISREFMVVINPDCFINKLVKLEFVDFEGNPVKIVNNRHMDLVVPTNMWTTLQINEINHNVFFVKDFDDNEDHHYVRVLSNAIDVESAARIADSQYLSNAIDLSTLELQNQIISNDADIQHLSAVADHIILVDSENISYKKTLPYLANLSHDITHDDLGYNYLSTFILQNIGINSPNKVKLGDMFKLSAVQSCLYDASVPPKALWFGENDYFIVNKDSMVSDLTENDIDIFRNAEKEFIQLSTALSNEIDNLSISLSDTVVLSVEKLQDQITFGSEYALQLSNAIDKLSDELSTEIDSLSTALSTDIDNLSTALSTEIDSLSTSLSIDIDSLSTALSNEIDNLSTSLSNTVVLSVEKLQDQVVANDNDIRFLSAEHDSLSTALSTEIDSLSASLSNTVVLSVEKLQDQIIANDNDINFLSVEHDSLSTALSNEIDSLSAALSTDIDNLSTALSNEIDNLSTSLSDTVVLSVEKLQDQIIANDNDIEFLSNDLSTLEYQHYNKTLSNDITLSHDFIDINGKKITKEIEVDQLIIVDEITFDRYRLTIRNGSLNINKVDSIVPTV